MGSLKRLEQICDGYDLPLTPREKAEQANRDYGPRMDLVPFSTPEQLRAMPYEMFLSSPYWQYVRKIVFFNKFHGRDPHCTTCGAKGEVLDIHHLTYEHHGDEHNHLEDLMVVCRPCHESLEEQKADKPITQADIDAALAARKASGS